MSSSQRTVFGDGTGTDGRVRKYNGVLVIKNGELIADKNGRKFAIKTNDCKIISLHEECVFGTWKVVVFFVNKFINLYNY